MLTDRCEFPLASGLPVVHTAPRTICWSDRVSTNIADRNRTTNSEGPSPAGSTPPELAEGVARLVNAVVKGVERQIEPHGLINMEFAILKAFNDKDEWTVTHLADLLPADAPRISRLVSRLVDRGLLRRRRRTDDRRVVLLKLTKQGREMTDELCESVNRHEAQLLAGVSAAELETLHSVTEKILANHATMERSSAR